MSLIQPFSQT